MSRRADEQTSIVIPDKFAQRTQIRDPRTIVHNIHGFPARAASPFGRDDRKGIA
jgi:hypothetical protein